MQLSNILKLFNQQDQKQEGVIAIHQINELLFNIYQSNKEYQIYFDNLLLQECKQFAIEDILMLITEIEYYEELRSSVLQQQQELNLSQMQCEILIAQLEISQRDRRRVDYLNNPLINNLISMLKDYQKVCNKQSDSKEMLRIENRIKEIKKKQNKRWKNYVNQLQKYQETLIQKSAQQHQYEQQKKWNEFVMDFQNSRFYKFNQLIEQQKKTIQDANLLFKVELQPKIFKVSKKVLDLRSKQKQLLKLKEFEKAEKVKEEADIIELLEKKQQETILKQQVKTRLKALKKKQSSQLQAFMQKVGSEQTTHLLQKQANENRWNNINKTCIQEISDKFNKDRIITIASRRSFDVSRLRTRSAHTQQKTNFSNQFIQLNCD